MRGQMTHLDTDVLAEFRAGLITGRRGVKIAAHLAGCDRCTALDDKLAGVSALLASVPAPPMPDSVAQRLEAVLAAEVTRKNYPERAQVDRPGKSGTHDRPAAKRGFRLATWRVLVPVSAAVVLLAAGGYGLSLLVGGPGSPSISPAAGSAATPSAASSSSAGRGGACQRRSVAAGDTEPARQYHARHTPALCRGRTAVAARLAPDESRVLARARVRAPPGRHRPAGPSRKCPVPGPAGHHHRRAHGP